MRVAALPKELIKSVHVSDSLAIDRDTEVPDQDVHRDVLIGGGCIPLQEWIDAVNGTLDVDVSKAELEKLAEHYAQLARSAAESGDMVLLAPAYAAQRSALAKEIARLVKRLDPAKRVVVGGPYAHHRSEEILRELFRLGDERYEELRHVFNGSIDRRPAAIARCTTTQDVVAAVNYHGSSGFDEKFLGSIDGDLGPRELSTGCRGPAFSAHRSMP